MRTWSPERIARSAGARCVHGAPSGLGPERVAIDSRTLQPGDLFVGLAGERDDGGVHAGEALAAGAWGVLVSPEHTRGLQGAATGVVLEHPNPLRALAALARAWRRELGARVVAITGSTGKTSTKDILAALLAPRLRVSASPQNFNTAIGVPLTMLAAPAGTQALVLELAMRAPGEVAELTAIAEPDVGVIVNVGPVHLEQLGTLEAVAAAKAELLAGLRPGTTIVVPAGERLLTPHLRDDVRTVTFGDDGDVQLTAVEPGGDVAISERAADGGRAASMRLRPSFAQAHNLRNLLAAVAAARALGVTPDGELAVRFSALRGERRHVRDGAVLIDDCYNANPMSMRAAIDDLAETAPGRRVAVLGDMLELGSDAGRFHREIGAHAAKRGVELLVTVGPLAAEMASAFPGEAHSVDDADAAAELLATLLGAGDTVLVKGSRGVGLERVGQALAAADRAPAREEGGECGQAPELARPAGPRRR